MIIRSFFSIIPSLKKTRVSFDFSDFPLRVLRRFPQKPFPFHFHEFSELVIVLSGQATHFTDSHEYPIMAGDVFLVKKDVAHGYGDLRDLDIVNILFDSARLHIPTADISELPGYHALFNLEPHFRLRLSPCQIEPAAALAEKMEAEISGKAPGYKFICISLFMELLARLSRAYDSEIGRPVRERDPVLGLANALSYLEKSYPDRIRIDDMITAASMSESALNRAFKKSTGFAPAQYLIRLRIRKACGLLRKTSYTITEIAFRTGFADSNYFSRQFKRVMGIPPKEYKKMSGAFQDAG